MPDYYAQIDVYVCASKEEGTPNPILEAMACGVPVISTDVGVVRQLFGDKQQEFILAERSVAELAKKIERLHHERNLLAEHSQENSEIHLAMELGKKGAPVSRFLQSGAQKIRCPKEWCLHNLN